MIKIGKWFKKDQSKDVIEKTGKPFVKVEETKKESPRDFTTRQGTINAIIDECKKQGIGLNTQIAYVLATVEHETGGTFKPVYESYYLGASKADAYLRKKKYYPYYGRRICSNNMAC